MLNRLTQTLDFQGQALLLRSERQRMLASNIANVDTPGYTARDIDFPKAMREAAAQVGALPTSQGSALSTVASHAQHMGAGGAGASRSTLSLAQSSMTYALAGQNSIDRNTVDMDRERATFADNSVRYEAALRFINGSVRTMLDAIKGGNN